MVEPDLNVALTLLRTVRGLTQDDLAKASGIPPSSISDYERGKKTPSFKTLERLVAAMEFSIRSVQRAQLFIRTVTSEPVMERMEGWSAAELTKAPVEPVPGEPASHPAVQWEVDQAAAEAGRALARLARVALVLLSRAATPIEIDAGD